MRRIHHANNVVQAECYERRSTGRYAIAGRSVTVVRVWAAIHMYKQFICMVCYIHVWYLKFSLLLLYMYIHLCSHSSYLCKYHHHLLPAPFTIASKFFDIVAYRFEQDCSSDRQLHDEQLTLASLPTQSAISCQLGFEVFGCIF
jgi:hypothetical protein